MKSRKVDRSGLKIKFKKKRKVVYFCLVDGTRDRKFLWLTTEANVMSTWQVRLRDRQEQFMQIKEFFTHRDLESCTESLLVSHFLWNSEKTERTIQRNVNRRHINTGIYNSTMCTYTHYRERRIKRNKHILMKYLFDLKISAGTCC